MKKTDGEKEKESRRSRIHQTVSHIKDAAPEKLHRLSSAVKIHRLSQSAHEISRENLRNIETDAIEGDRNIWYRDDGKGGKIIVAGSVSRLLDLFAQHFPENQTAAESFLSVHHSFISSVDLLNILINLYYKAEAFQAKQREVTQTGVANMIHSWVFKFGAEFVNGKEYLNGVLRSTLKQFVKSLTWDLHYPPFALLNETVVAAKKASRAYKSPRNFVRGHEENKISVLDLDPSALADQLTLIELNMIQKIQPKEFLNQSWLADNRESLAPNLVAMIRWFNQTSKWVTTEMLKRRDNMTEKTTMLTFFVRLAENLYKLRNYNGLMEVINGLHRPIIVHHVNTIVLPPPLETAWKTLLEFMSPDKNYRRYRQALKVLPSATTAIPFLGPLLTKITFLDYTMQDYIDSGVINFEKVRHLAFKLEKFCRKFMQKSYSIKYSEYLTLFILNVEIFEDETMVTPYKHRFSGELFDSSIAVAMERQDSTDRISIATPSSEPMEIDVKTPMTPARYPSMTGMATLSTIRRSSSIEESQISWEDWEKLVSIATTRRYLHGEVIMEQGSYNRNLYKIQSGQVTIQKTVTGPKGLPFPINVGIMGKGQMLGEMSVLHLGLTSASVVASSDEVIMFVMSEENVYNLFNSDAGLSGRFYKSLAQQLAQRVRALPPPKPKALVATPIDRKRDRRIGQLFKLPEGETIVKEYRCGMGKKKGILYLSINHLCFFHKFFAHKARWKLPLSEIEEITFNDGKVEIGTFAKEREQFRGFTFPELAQDCYSFMTRLLKDFRTKTEQFISSDNFQEFNSNQDDVASMGSVERDRTDSETEASTYSLSYKDWDIIRSGARSFTYRENEVIVAEGQRYQKVYFIVGGSCNVVKKHPNGESVHVGVMVEDETFGELSFLDGENSAATASVIAGEDGTEVSIIDGEFINVLFLVKPEIAGKFFRYLATNLASLLKKRESKSIAAEEENMVEVSNLLEKAKEYSREKRGVISKRGNHLGSSWALRFCEVKGGCFIIYNSDQEPTPENAITETQKILPLLGAMVKISSATNFSFKILTGKWSRSFAADSMEEMQDWVGAVAYWTTLKNRFDSYSPERIGISAKFLIDGCETFNAISDIIENAKSTIFITDWFLVPEIYLRRPDPASISDRLDRILLKKAKQGVRVCVLIWNETSIAIKLNSAGVKKKLEALHPNIFCIRHPPLEPLNWSHHQKMVVVDSRIAVVGGLDMCYGRWDTQAHLCIDNCHLSLKWPGKDYANPNRKTLDHPEFPFREYLDRTTVPRMGWHDIAMVLDGPAAWDVAYNFIQRWNHHKDFIGETSAPYLHTLGTPVPSEGGHMCQVVRSICEWSGGNFVEHSVYNAYIDAIRNAQHFIYIENQYFISSLSGGGIENAIAEEILNRILRAIEANEVFRVIVLLPITPDGVYGENASIRYVMHWQYETLCRGANSILEQLKSKCADPHDYITFHSLRAWGELEIGPVTEQIYIHAKMMIVDDRKVIIGSANINDRSLRGDRDSEIAVISEDSEQIEINFSGQPFKVSKSVHHLRVRLWKEHMGIPGCENPDISGADSEYLEDPVSLSSFQFWRQRSRANTRLFEDVFPTIPSDDILTWQMLQKKEMEASRMTDPEKLHLLSNVKGHLVDFPTGFLKSENLRPDFGNIKVRAVDRSIFQ